MGAVVTSGLALIAMTAGIAAGRALGRHVPDDHLGSESKETIRIAMAMIATLTALVLGLLVASAKSSFDAQTTSIQHIAADILLTDRMLAEYGAESGAARAALKSVAIELNRRLWPKEATRLPDVTPAESRATTRRLLTGLAELEPATPVQQALKPQILESLATLAGARFYFYAESIAQLPPALLTVLVVWLVLLFTGYSMLAPTNVTAQLALLSAAASVAGALFLIMELESPFDGIIQISSLPISAALAHLGE